ncbi:MAG TPA: 1-deoxy-D-xylulose-5-phosphate synthase [Patescibacteria group bacterium]|nr:1-deoxy-D-xylulose-5-phosphate synthase [Patescibacteria group bacterium]
MTSISWMQSLEQLKKLPVHELPGVAGEVRRFLLESLAATGGHIGASLATVELTIALHYVFESPQDQLLWDTGHQGYAHKLLTGRYDRFPTLNSYGGMSRFVARAESVHDVMDATHAGTAISTGLGIALAKKLQQDSSYTVAIVGDGALAEGLSLEGLNHAAVEAGIRLVVVINDNGFAISPGFGAIHNYLAARQVGAAVSDTLFTALGMEYIGPVDGHDPAALVAALEQAKLAVKLPVVHVKTEKGHGLPPAADHPYRLHFSFPFDQETGKTLPGYASVGYPDHAAQVIKKAMDQDQRIVAITPSTKYATGLESVFKEYPERCFDPGMAEQHAMSLTAGFALAGCKPVIFYQSTFMQRAFDQLFHDVCFMELPVLILAARAGLAGYDGATHHGIYDISYLRGLPNLTMMYPKDRFEMERMIMDSLNHLTGPVWIGMPYGPIDALDENVLNESAASFAQAEEVLAGKDLLLVTMGNKYKEGLETVTTLRQSGVDAGLLNLRHLKPLPVEQLCRLLRSTPRVVSLEENIVDGGMGSALAELILDADIPLMELLRLGLPGQFIEGGSTAELISIFGLDSPGILASIQRRWPALCQK